jgi:hypothetical protein
VTSAEGTIIWNCRSYEETFWSGGRSFFRFFPDGKISPESNLVATLNGDALGLHIKLVNGPWQENPDYQDDIVPILKHVVADSS